MALEQAEEIRKLITSILSKLLNMADVAESVRTVQVRGRPCGGVGWRHFAVRP